MNDGNGIDFLLWLLGNAIHTALNFAAEEDKFHNTLVRYANECCDALRQRSPSMDIFSVKNLTDSGSMYHFSLIGAMSTHPSGVMALDKSGILQILSTDYKNIKKT
ncbi:hypothetical protein KIN20_031612 [Parelaphostrongylus tenuis]|uniref:Uncharacterized protein n=1 Tax=Parelaphostrongylus tenuis TaxID=148309 RepID=A0AAD5R5D8_PARTN|nr:hypothetical protein KIN20_031612 [Parelaphostrongylus tenuis]